MTITVKWKRFRPEARMPEYAYSSDYGADLRWFGDVEGMMLWPGNTDRFWLGIGVRLPEGYELQLRPRSSMSARGIICAFGTCDESYTGQLAAVLTNTTNEPIAIKRGDAICQAVIVPRYRATFEEVDDLGEAERGAAGFGSTDKR